MEKENLLKSVDELVEENKTLKKVEQAYRRTLIACLAFKLEQTINEAENEKEEIYYKGINSVLDIVVEIGQEIFKEELKILDELKK